ncbi:MAG: hypothetical protein DRI71_09785 [Bacteroidetes bacterium]|nr:MAG: hypothetical protein DRI71_09785 [Bacteroidota bacterium]
MKAAVSAIFLTFLVHIGFSQTFPSEMWHEGQLVLVTEEVISGVLKYDQVQGIVQVEVGEKIYTYSAKSIFHFKIYDSTADSYREFYSLPYGLVTSYKVPVIFEVLIEGNITLLSREYVVTKNIQDPFSFGSYAKEVLVYDYYFLDKEGNITKYTLKKKDLYNALSKRQSQIIDYMKTNRLRHDKRNDLIRVILFYNALI